MSRGMTATFMSASEGLSCNIEGLQNVREFAFYLMCNPVARVCSPAGSEFLLHAESKGLAPGFTPGTWLALTNEHSEPSWEAFR